MIIHKGVPNVIPESYMHCKCEKIIFHIYIAYHFHNDHVRHCVDCVREGAYGIRVKINILPSVNGSIFVHSHESLSDSFATFWIHGERASVPIDGASKFSKLIIDCATILFLPLIHLLPEMTFGVNLQF